MTESNAPEFEAWKRAEAVFRQLPDGVQHWLRTQARDTLLRMLDRELQKYKGKMGTPPIYFPRDLGIPETFMVVRNPKTRGTLAALGLDIPVLVCARGRWDKNSEAKIEAWAETAAIALAGHQYGAGVQRAITGRAAGSPHMEYAHFGVEPKDFDLARMETALTQWLREVNPDWLAQEEAKYAGAKVVEVPEGTPSQVGWARTLHLPAAKPLAVGLVLLRRYLRGDPNYDAFRGSLHIPSLTIVGEQLPALQTVPGARDRIARLHQYDQEQYDAVLWELAVAARYAALGYDVAFLPEDPRRKRPDLRLVGRTPETYIECKRSSVHSQYDVNERAEWHRICDPIVHYLRAHRLEVDIETHFFLPLDKISTDEVFEAFQNLTSRGAQEAVNERFRLTIRFLPPLQELPYPVSQFSPAFPRMLFGVEDDRSLDGFSTLITPKEISEDGLWVYSVYWRACLRWKSSSYATLYKKARGVLMKLVGGAEQIPERAHGILHLAVQEWPRSDLRELRWAKIFEELGQFHHSAEIRLPYILLNRLIARVNQSGGPDIEENCVVLLDEAIGDPSEADRLPHLIFSANP